MLPISFMTIRPNFQIDNKYKIVSEISKRKNPPLFLVRLNNSSKHFIIKIFFDLKDATFLNEVQALKNLKSDFIIKIIDSQEEGKVYNENGDLEKTVNYIIYELCINGQLSRLVGKNLGNFKEKHAKKILYSMALEINHIHSKKYAHCDLKLSKFLMNKDFFVILSGLTLAHKNDGRRSFSPGPKGHIAPEVHFRRKSIDAKQSDVYSLGVCFINFSTGKEFNPFNCKIKGLKSFENYRKIFFKELEDSNNFDKGFIELVKKMTEIDPKNRIKIEDVLKHSFFNGVELISNDELKTEMSKRNEALINKQGTIEEVNPQIPIAV